MNMQVGVKEVPATARGPPCGQWVSERWDSGQQSVSSWRVA